MPILKSYAILDTRIVTDHRQNLDEMLGFNELELCSIFSFGARLLLLFSGELEQSSGSKPEQRIPNG